MDPVQTATFAALSPWTRTQDAALVRQDQAQEDAQRVGRTERDDALDGGLGADAAAARQAAGQEAAPGGESNPGGSGDPRDPSGGRGRLVDLMA